MNTKQAETFLSLERAAIRLGVPAAWLKTEARAGRIPYLKAGRRVLFHLETVERALLERVNELEGANDD